MANTYTQIYMHIIFAVKNRMSLITPEHESGLYAYIAGACNNHKHHLLAIGGWKDHVHLLIGMHPAESVSDLVQSLKIQTSKWMREHYGVAWFSWQSGFGAFSYSKSFLPQVEHYIQNQKEHHKKFSFEEEMRMIYKEAGIDYDERYMMKGENTLTDEA